MSYKVLLVEDTEVLAKIYLKYLKSSPLDVTHVSKGADALKALKNHSFDLMLLDLRLPDMDGLDVLRQMKHGDMPVIAMTAFVEDYSGEKVASMGARELLYKPFSSERLIHTLAKYLDLNLDQDAQPECYKHLQSV